MRPDPAHWLWVAKCSPLQQSLAITVNGRADASSTPIIIPEATLRRTGLVSENPIRVRVVERGFALIVMIWLLVLAGSIVAFLMLRAMQTSTATSGEAELLQNELAMHAALNTMVAQWVAQGSRSEWHLPGSHSIDVDGTTVSITTSSENGRLDINTAAPERIDQFLASANVSRDHRLEVMGALEILRGEKRTVDDQATLDAVLAPARTDVEGACLSDGFTLYSGLAEPTGGFSRKMSQQSSGSDQGAPETDFSFGEPVRVILSVPTGQSSTAIIRVTGQRDVFHMLTWRQKAACDG